MKEILNLENHKNLSIGENFNWNILDDFSSDDAYIECIGNRNIFWRGFIYDGHIYGFKLYNGIFLCDITRCKVMQRCIVIGDNTQTELMYLDYPLIV